MDVALTKETQTDLDENQADKPKSKLIAETNTMASLDTIRKQIQRVKDELKSEF